MIIEYCRPQTIEEALALLGRTEPVSLPLGGGSSLNQPSPSLVAAVDLQALGLSTLKARGNFLDLGATLTLQALLDETAAGTSPVSLPPALKRAIQHEAAYNLRQVATVAGGLVAADGRSPFTTAMLALDAALTLLPGEELVSLGDLLPFRGERLRQRLITQVSIPLNAGLAYEYVARSPADRPIVCVAAAAWPSGRIRVALGGFGQVPLLAFDGTEPGGVELAAQSAFSQAGDVWATAEYRQGVVGTLVRRCIQELT